MNHLNQGIIEQMESEALKVWREHIVQDMGDMAVYLTQIDWVLEQRGER